MASRENVVERVKVTDGGRKLGAKAHASGEKTANVEVGSDGAQHSLAYGRAPGLRSLPGMVCRIRSIFAPAAISDAVGGIFVPVSAFVVVSASLLLFAAIVGASPHVAGEVTLPSYVLRPELEEWEETFFSPWQHWDGLWYLKIAAQGYDYYDYSVAFFPLYPLLVGMIASFLNVKHLVAAVATSAVSYLVALLYLYRLARLEIGERAARRSVIYQALFPTAFFFLAVYTESLFLALTLATFWSARKSNWVAAGILGLLASLTRSTGLFLLLPLLVEYLQQRGFRPREVKADVLSLLLVPAGMAIYALYNFIYFGDPLAFVRAQIHWERGLDLPWQTLVIAWDSAVNGTNIPLVTEPDGSLLYQALYTSNLAVGDAVNLVFFVFGLALSFLAFVKLRPTYACYALLVILVPLINPSETQPLLSMPRFMLVLFPLLFVLALIGKNRIAHWGIIAVFTAGLFFFLIRFASWYWVA
ncbi:MAG: glycosyltransferase family 39 protein [Chloroflexi bacterium]|nr:glycosyltransferase family 39 protein [Chloroflexota bacterium]